MPSSGACGREGGDLWLSSFPRGPQGGCSPPGPHLGSSSGAWGNPEALPGSSCLGHFFVGPPLPHEGFTWDGRHRFPRSLDPTVLSELSQPPPGFGRGAQGCPVWLYRLCTPHEHWRTEPTKGSIRSVLQLPSWAPRRGAFSYITHKHLQELLSLPPPPPLQSICFFFSSSPSDSSEHFFPAWEAGMPCDFLQIFALSMCSFWSSQGLSF